MFQPGFVLGGLEGFLDGPAGPGGKGPLDHVAVQHELGGRLPELGDAGTLPALGVLGPGFGQVELPVQECSPGFGSISEEHADLAVSHPTGGARIQAGNTG